MTAPECGVIWHKEVQAGAPVGDVGREVVYAVGDVHGCYDLVQRLLSAIADDMRPSADGMKPTIVFCGDYIDRGPRSSDVLSMLIWMQRHAPCDVICLKGNHEAMMLAFLEAPRDAALWLRNGGDETLRSYGVESKHDEPTGSQLDDLRDALLDALPASHLEFVRQLRVHWTRGDYIFVHAGLRPGVRIGAQKEEDCLWIRDDFLDADHVSDKIVVHGHSWRSHDPMVTRTRIGIDTGAYQTGVLTAVRLAGPTAAFVQAHAGEHVIMAPQAVRTEAQEFR